MIAAGVNTKKARLAQPPPPLMKQDPLRISSSDLNRKSPFSNNYTFERILYLGELGEVSVLKSKKSVQKVLEKSFALNTKSEFEETLKTVKTYFNFDCPTILKVYDYATQHVNELCSEHYNIRVFFESFDRTLEEAVSERKKESIMFSGASIERLLSDVGTALEFLLRHRMSYNCLTPKHIGVHCLDGEVLTAKLLPLFDFNKNLYEVSVRSMVSNSELYIAPEIFEKAKLIFKNELDSRIDPHKVDIFALGLVMLKLGVLESTAGLYSPEMFNRVLLEEMVDEFKMLYNDDCKVACDTIDMMLLPNPALRIDPSRLLKMVKSNSDVQNQQIKKSVLKEQVMEPNKNLQPRRGGEYQGRIQDNPLFRRLKFPPGLENSAVQPPNQNQRPGDRDRFVPQKPTFLAIKTQPSVSPPPKPAAIRRPAQISRPANFFTKPQGDAPVSVEASRPFQFQPTSIAPQSERVVISNPRYLQVEPIELRELTPGSSTSSSGKSPFTRNDNPSSPLAPIVHIPSSVIRLTETLPGRPRHFKSKSLLSDSDFASMKPLPPRAPTKNDTSRSPSPYRPLLPESSLPSASKIISKLNGNMSSETTGPNRLQEAPPLQTKQSELIPTAQLPRSSAACVQRKQLSASRSAAASPMIHTDRHQLRSVDCSKPDARPLSSASRLQEPPPTSAPALPAFAHRVHVQQSADASTSRPAPNPTEEYFPQPQENIRTNTITPVSSGRSFPVPVGTLSSQITPRTSHVVRGIIFEFNKQVEAIRSRSCSSEIRRPAARLPTPPLDWNSVVSSSLNAGFTRKPSEGFISERPRGVSHEIAASAAVEKQEPLSKQPSEKGLLTIEMYSSGHSKPAYQSTGGFDSNPTAFASRREACSQTISKPDSQTSSHVFPHFLTANSSNNHLQTLSKEEQKLVNIGSLANASAYNSGASAGLRNFAKEEGFSKSDDTPAGIPTGNLSASPRGTEEGPVQIPNIGFNSVASSKQDADKLNSQRSEQLSNREDLAAGLIRTPPATVQPAAESGPMLRPEAPIGLPRTANEWRRNESASISKKLAQIVRSGTSYAPYAHPLIDENSRTQSGYAAPRFVHQFAAGSVRQRVQQQLDSDNSLSFLQQKNVSNQTFDPEFVESFRKRRDSRSASPIVYKPLSARADSKSRDQKESNAPSITTLPYKAKETANETQGLNNRIDYRSAENESGVQANHARNLALEEYPPRPADDSAGDIDRKKQGYYVSMTQPPTRPLSTRQLEPSPNRSQDRSLEKTNRTLLEHAGEDACQRSNLSVRTTPADASQEKLTSQAASKLRHLRPPNIAVAASQSANVKRSIRPGTPSFARPDLSQPGQAFPSGKAPHTEASKPDSMRRMLQIAEDLFETYESSENKHVAVGNSMEKQRAGHDRERETVKTVEKYHQMWPSKPNPSNAANMEPNEPRETAKHSKDVDDDSGCEDEEDAANQPDGSRKQHGSEDTDGEVNRIRRELKEKKEKYDRMVDSEQGKPPSGSLGSNDRANRPEQLRSSSSEEAGRTSEVLRKT